MARKFKPGQTKMNYALEQRMRFIDFCLLEFQSVSAMKVVRFYGVGERTARDDLRLYQAIAPGNMEKVSAGNWGPTSDFKPLFNY